MTNEIVINLIDSAIHHLTELRAIATGNEDDYQRAKSLESTAHGWRIIKLVAEKRQQSHRGRGE